jgi:hypothetical protein
MGHVLFEKWEGCMFVWMVCSQGKLWPKMLHLPKVSRCRNVMVSYIYKGLLKAFKRPSQRWALVPSAPLGDDAKGMTAGA